MRAAILALLILSACCCEVPCESRQPAESVADLAAEAEAAGADGRSAISSRLAAQGPAGRDAALGLLAHADPSVRLTGLEALRLQGEPDESTVAALSGALRDPDPRVRAEAARTLEGPWAAGALGPLRAALQDDAFEVRYHAARSLGAAGWPAYEHREALLQRGRHDLDRRVREAAMAAHETVRLAWIDHTRASRPR
jgi:HEAT repeat protein